VPERLRDRWDDAAEQIDAYARYLANTGNMTPARKAFEELSKQVALLLQRFGNPISEEIKLAYCPMAFDGRGATWVQRQDTVTNSYFGAEMPNCGEIQSQVAPGDHLPMDQPAQPGQSARPEPQRPAPAAGHVH
jgi:Cu(I)/Ag(I) efflux system membrane fusion protein